MDTNQVKMVSTEQLVLENHTYRKLKTLLNFNKTTKSVKVKVCEIGANGYCKIRLVLCPILHFIEDLSDREFERFVSENNAAKWFCEFSLMSVLNFAKI